MSRLWLYLSLLGVIGLIPFEGNYVFFLFFLLMLLYKKDKKKMVKFEDIKKGFYVAFISEIFVVSFLQCITYFNNTLSIEIYKIGFLLSVPILVLYLLILGIRRSINTKIQS